MVFFSIIATDYENTVSPAVLQRFIDSLKAQTFKDFEVLILHDGERKGDLTQINTDGLNIRFLQSMFRTNTWGHSLRTYGMLKASGEYFINTNSDNLYYPTALEDVHKVILEQPKIKVFINYVRMMGMYEYNEPITLGDGHVINRKKIVYDNPRDYRKSLVLTGEPPIWGNIDLMSLIAHRSVWEKIFYWFSVEQSSDGMIYSKICSMYPYYNTQVLLGEHY